MTAVEADRQKLALESIKQAFGTEVGEDIVNLFVEHHLDDLPQRYWQQHLGSSTPEPAAIIDLPQLRESWGEGRIEYFDFTLPDEVTDYVISVHFDNEGAIDGISMES